MYTRDSECDGSQARRLQVAARPAAAECNGCRPTHSCPARGGRREEDRDGNGHTDVPHATGAALTLPANTVNGLQPGQAGRSRSGAPDQPVGVVDGSISAAFFGEKKDREGRVPECWVWKVERAWCGWWGETGKTSKTRQQSCKLSSKRREVARHRIKRNAKPGGTQLHLRAPPRGAGGPQSGRW